MTLWYSVKYNKFIKYDNKYKIIINFPEPHSLSYMKGIQTQEGRA